MVYTVITGASKGIGKALAHECARKGLNLILVALPNDGLKTLAENINADHHVDVKTYEVDLTATCSTTTFFNWCQDHNFQVNMLINNAGFGMQGTFDTLSYEDKQRMMQLNMQTLVSLTYLFLPMMKKQKQAYILNVGSIASYMTIPYKAVYAATKNFVRAFSYALNYELRKTNISVSCLCPGPTITNAHVKAQVEKAGYSGKLFTMPAQTVAMIAMDGLLRRKRTIVPGMKNKLFTALGKHLPTSWTLFITANIFGRVQPD